MVRDAWKLRDLWAEIEALDSTLKAEAQTRMLVASQRFLLRTVQWTLRRLPQPIDTMAATEQLGAAVAALGDLPTSLIGEAESTALNERAAAFEALGAPPRHRAPGLGAGDPGGGRRPDAGGQGQRLQPGGGGAALLPAGRAAALARLEAAAHKLPRDGQWPSQAAVAMHDELAALHADLLEFGVQTAGRHAIPRCSAGARAASSRSSGSIA